MNNSNTFLVELRTVKPVQLAYSEQEGSCFSHLFDTVKVKARKDWGNWLARYNARQEEQWEIVGMSQFIPSIDFEF